MKIVISSTRNPQTQQESLLLTTPDGNVDGVFLLGSLDILLETCVRNFKLTREQVMQHVEIRHQERLHDMIEDKELN